MNPNAVVRRSQLSKIRRIFIIQRYKNPTKSNHNKQNLEKAIEENDAELTTEIYTRYVDTELKYLSKYERKEDSFNNHEIGEAAEDYVEALVEGKQRAYLIDKDNAKWQHEYEDEVFEESTEAIYKLNAIKKITFENEENQKKFDRLVKYGEEYSKRDD